MCCHIFGRYFRKIINESPIFEFTYITLISSSVTDSRHAGSAQRTSHLNYTGCTREYKSDSLTLKIIKQQQWKTKQFANVLL